MKKKTREPLSQQKFNGAVVTELKNIKTKFGIVYILIFITFMVAVYGVL